MIRVLRYPRLSALFLAAALACSIARDACVNAQIAGWPHVLLIATAASLLLCLSLFSCRFIVADWGVSVAFLLHTRHTTWDQLAAMGALCCNSRRMYLYGMYRGETDFCRLLHHAPRCGRWGFVVPLSDALREEILLRCPFPVDLSPIAWQERPQGMRRLTRVAAAHMLVLTPLAAALFALGALLVLRAVGLTQANHALVLTLCAALLFAAGALLVHRVGVSRATRPSISEAGISIGRALYLPWEQVRFGYVHRIARTSGFFLLSQRPEDIALSGSPPVICLSMPDTSTVLLAYLTYCPHAPKAKGREWL